MKFTHVFVATAFLAGCGGGASAPPLGASIPPASRAPFAHHRVGLGKVLSSQEGGQIFGFDIDRNGDDGVLATASNVETFDQDTGTIAKVFPKKLPSGTSYSVANILADDLGLVIRYVTPNGSIYAKRFYDVMDPVTKNKFTGKWKPPVKDIQVEQAGPNQSTSTTAIFAIELKNQDRIDVFSSDVSTNTFGKIFHPNPNSVGIGDSPQFAQDTATNQAVIATTPDGGRVGGEPPINILIDLKTGKETQFDGLNNGYYGSGFVNGLAVDSSTGIAATTTELNAQVEFYNLATQSAAFAQLPCTSDTSQLNSGSGIANDPVNGLFLVTDTYYCSGSQGSAIVVYDESGNVVESITGFKFPIGVGAPAINPSKRMGWVTGPGVNQIQQFFY
jgi:hypothetical protein